MTVITTAHYKTPPMNTAPENAPPTQKLAQPLLIRATVVLVLSMLSAWLAAGSLGWIAPPLQKSLTWLAFAAIVISSLPARRVTGRDLSILAGAIAIALAMTASSLAVVNTLAVALLLAAVAYLQSGMIAAASRSVALAASALAVFRLVCDGSATAWTIANAIGHFEGRWAGMLTGRRLVIGASFGGLDFLVLMIVYAAVWLRLAPKPRHVRVAGALLFVVLAQTAYLVILACNNDIVALLPPEVRAKTDDLSHLGVWAWGNAVRTLLPWNLPLLAAIFHCVIAVGIFRGVARQTGPFLSDPESEEAAVADRKRRNRQSDCSAAGSSQWGFALFGPAGLMIVAVVALTVVSVQPDLKDRRIVAYDGGSINWTAGDPGMVAPGSLPSYGLLPAMVESLGGNFIRSRDLTEADLQAADVLIIVPPRASTKAAARAAIPEDLRARIWRFVADGGRLIVGGDPETSPGVDENSLNPLLDRTAMSFRDDTSNSVTERWEDNLQSAPHAATASSSPGRDYFSFDRAASIRVSWPAGPLVTGRWGWDELGTDPLRTELLPYAAGNHLGDLVLAAQQHVGKGSVVVLSAAACLSNDGIPFSLAFTGPLLSALARNSSTPLDWWRQLAGVAAAGAAIVLLFRACEPRTIAAAAVALALALVAGSLFNNVSGQLLPSGPKTSAQPIIYIDGSHLEGMGRDPWGEDGAGRLTRVLADNGYLPLIAPDVALGRLSRATMLISIAPAKPFADEEIAAVKQFVSDGGFFLSTVGSPDAEPSRGLLEELDLHIKPMPVPPWDHERETTPEGFSTFSSGEQDHVWFYAAWPVTGAPNGVLWPTGDPAHRPVIAGSHIDNGQAFLIGDSAFALKKNFKSLPTRPGLLPEPNPNPKFWENQLRNWLGREPPRGAANTGPISGLPKPNADPEATP
jgi:hypothetical protein